MNYWLVVIFSFSIIIAATIGWVRFRKINPAYYPFIYCIWLAFLNEILSFIFAQTIRDNSVNNNLYALAESLLIVWQFRNWGIFKNKDNSIILLHLPIITVLPILLSLFCSV